MYYARRLRKLRRRRRRRGQGDDEFMHMTNPRQSLDPEAVQDAIQNPSLQTLTPDVIRVLQSTYGNAFVTRLLEGTMITDRSKQQGRLPDQQALMAVAGKPGQDPLYSAVLQSIGALDKYLNNTVGVTREEILKQLQALYKLYTGLQTTVSAYINQKNSADNANSSDAKALKYLAELAPAITEEKEAAARAMVDVLSGFVDFNTPPRLNTLIMYASAGDYPNNIAQLAKVGEFMPANPVADDGDDDDKSSDEEKVKEEQAEEQPEENQDDKSPDEKMLTHLNAVDELNALLQPDLLRRAATSIEDTDVSVKEMQMMMKILGKPVSDFWLDESIADGLELDKNDDLAEDKLFLMKNPQLIKLLSKLQLLDVLAVRLKGPDDFEVLMEGSDDIASLTDISETTDPTNDKQLSEDGLDWGDVKGMGRYIDRDLAIAITDIHPDVVKYVLEGLLKEKDLTKLINRFKAMQNYLKDEGKFLEPGQWDEATLEALIRENGKLFVQLRQLWK